MEYQLVMDINLKENIIPDKFTAAVILSAGAHLLAFYLASSWAIDIPEKETRKLETLITQVHLVEPAKPKPRETRVIEAMPWANSNHKNAAQALAKPMDNPTEVKVAGIDPTHLTRFTNRVENYISPSPRNPSSDPSVATVHAASPVKTPLKDSYQESQTTKPAIVPKKQKSGKSASLITATRPSSFTISQNRGKRPSPVERSSKIAMEINSRPAIATEDNSYIKYMGLHRRDPFAPIIRENSEPNTKARPANLSDFQTKYSSSKRSSPVKMASVPRDVMSSASGDHVSGDELIKILGEYTRKVRDKIASVKKFPRLARDRGYEGQPVVAFTIKKNGRLLGYSLAITSGHSILDKSALETVKKAVPYPEIPGKLNMETINLKLPISYILQ